MTRRRRKNPFQFLTKKFPKRMQKKLVMLFMAIILAFVVIQRWKVYQDRSEPTAVWKQDHSV